jgi:ribosomal protein S18 acetylase RimI-like enzyme
MDKKKYIIRKAEISDAKELETLMKSAYSIYTELLKGEVLPPMEADYMDEIMNYPTWIMEYEECMAGGLIMYFDDENASLSNIAVSPIFKGMGFGRALIEFAENTARERGYESLSLATHIKLLDNIAYYSKLGYEEMERDNNKVYFSKILGD